MAKTSIPTDANFWVAIVGPRGGLRRTLTFKSRDAMWRYLKPFRFGTGHHKSLRLEDLQIERGPGRHDYMFAKLVAV
jgi:hypothetical protein